MISGDCVLVTWMYRLPSTCDQLLLLQQQNKFVHDCKHFVCFPTLVALTYKVTFGNCRMDCRIYYVIHWILCQMCTIVSVKFVDVIKWGGKWDIWCPGFSKANQGEPCFLWKRGWELNGFMFKGKLVNTLLRLDFGYNEI